MEKKKFCQAINFLPTGLRIYTGKSKARGPHNVLSGQALRRALGFVFARIDTQAS